MSNMKNLVEGDKSALLETIEKKLPNSIWIIPADLNGGIKWISSAVSMQRGYSPEEVKAQSLEDIFTDESLAIVYSTVQEEIYNEQDPNVDKDRVIILELEMKCKDGSTIWTENQISFLHDKDEKLEAFLGVTKDITDKKVALKRKELAIRILSCLNETEEGIDRIIDEILSLIRDRMGVLSVSLRFLDDGGGYDENEKSFSLINKTEFGSEWDDSLATIPIKIRQKIIGVVEMDSEGHEIFNEDLIKFFEKIMGSLGVAIDRDKSRKELELKREQLMHSKHLQALGRLVAGIAHDFNNLLVPIISGVDVVLSDSNIDSDSKEILTDIQQSGQRGAELTRQLLAFGRKQSLSRQSLKVSELFVGFENILKRMLGEKINVKFSVSDDLENIYADKYGFSQVISNLALNARDAMPNGGDIYISATNKTFAASQLFGNEILESGNYVSITVSDTGIGISEENINKLFEPFFTTKPFYKGSGLGLSVVHGIVKQHGGRIDVSSKEGEGATFEILLPVSGDDVKKSVNKKIEVGIEKNLDGKKILIIEDDIRVQRIVATFLKRVGAIVVKASTGKEARELYENSNGDFDVIFSDVVLPDGNGVNVVMEFKESGYKGGVLLTSGYPADSDIEGLSKDMEIPFLQKPILSDRQLVNKILSVIGENKKGA